MDEGARMAVESACEKLITAYCHLVDHGQASEIADLFTEDGVWTSSENTMTGRDQIRAGFQAREDNKGRMSRHVCNNFQLNDVGENEAHGVVYLTLYRHDGKEDRTVSPLNGPAMVGEYRDHFVRTDRGWRFARREAIADFVRFDEARSESSHPSD